ncbi:MAG: nucleotidyl transferase AbiEii/AbiGii toxin family protein [Elusimicrobiota bacterium]
MAPRSFELREFFHLALLRHLATRLSGRDYAVKGGICLRFFYRSPRLSQDMDLDIVSNVRLKTLENAVDSVLQGQAFAASLLQQGITSITASKPKQTATTQRWKAALYSGVGEPLSTKIEFSRRQDRIICSTGMPDAELLSHYRMTPFAAQFYNAASMTAQKIAALASPTRYALRDLFDLHHLLRVILVKPEDAAKLLETKTLESAADKVGRFTFGDFKEQVLPYLTGELIAMYRKEDAFERQKSEVEQALMEMLK